MPELPKVRRGPRTAEALVLRREAHFGDRVVKCFAGRPRSLYALFAAAVASNPDGEALICGDQRLTWRDLHKHSERLAHSLARRGVSRSDRVAVLLGNRSEWIVTLFAVSRLDAIFVPLNIREQKRELTYVLKDCGAAVIIYEDELAPRVPVLSECETLLHRISIGEVAGSESFQSLLQEPDYALDPPGAQEEDVAAILYTSGTTGQPKGVMLCNLNIVHSAMHYASAMDLTQSERSLVVVPLGHVTGFIAHVAAITHCAGALILSARFKASEFIATALQEKITHTVMVPAMYKLCLLDPDLQRLRSSSWRIAAYGGAVMAPAAISELSQVLPSLSLMNLYGATETCSPATIMPAGLTAHHSASVGKPVLCGELRIMDEFGAELPAGHAGEIWIAGPMVAKGYWNNPSASKAAFTAGFWRSGDIGYMDPEGFVFLCDRKKDVINRGGYKIYPAEIENVLLEFPGMIECAVLAKPCAVLGERVHAVVSFESSAASEASLRDFCSERLADYKVPETFTFRDTPLPRNPSGKLLKRVLREELKSEPG